MTDEKASVVAVEPAKKLEGVKGWLLAFCVFSTIIYPLAMLANTAALSKFSRFGPLFNFLTVFSIGLLALGVYTGIMLWSRRASGPKLAKIFLSLLMVYSVLLLIAPSTAKSFTSGMMRYSLQVKPEFYTQRWIGLITQVLWLAYFYRSRRVQNTYPKLPVPPGPGPAGGPPERPGDKTIEPTL
jgi:hypothetical protein